MNFLKKKKNVVVIKLPLDTTEEKKILILKQTRIKEPFMHIFIEEDGFYYVLSEIELNDIRVIPLMLEIYAYTKLKNLNNFTYIYKKTELEDNIELLKFKIKEC